MGRLRARAQSRSGTTTRAALARSCAASPVRGEVEVQHVLLLAGAVDRRFTGSSARRAGATGCHSDRPATRPVPTPRSRPRRRPPARAPGPPSRIRRRRREVPTTSPLSTIVSPGKHRPLHPEADPPEPAVGTGPIGQIPLEPGGLVGRVQEDVARTVALDGEVLVVVHRSPVARRQSTEHDGRRGHLVGSSGS
jgi:hypothetical protein